MAGDSGFTAGEMKLVQSMLKYGDIQTNFDKVAEELGYKSGGVAKQRWGQIKKKFGNATAPAGGADKTPSKKAQGTKRTPADEVGDDEEGTPVKTPAKRGRKFKTENQEENAAGDDDVAEVKMKTEQEDEDGFLLGE